MVRKWQAIEDKIKSLDLTTPSKDRQSVKRKKGLEFSEAPIQKEPELPEEIEHEKKDDLRAIDPNAWFESLKRTVEKLPPGYQPTPNDVYLSLLRDLKGNELKVYLILFFESYRFKRNWCSMSKPKIIEATGISRAQLFKHLAKLEKEGLIVQKTGLGIRSPEFIVRLPEEASTSSFQTSGNQTFKKRTSVSEYVKRPETRRSLRSSLYKQEVQTRINTHTKSTRVCVSDLPSRQSDFALSDLSQTSLDGYYSRYTPEQILRALITVGKSYDKIPADVKSPEAILESCLRSWSLLSDHEIIELINTAIGKTHIVLHKNQEDLEYWKEQGMFQELETFYKWLSDSAASTGMEQIWEKYKELCPTLINKELGLLSILFCQK